MAHNQEKEIIYKIYTTARKKWLKQGGEFKRLFLEEYDKHADELHRLHAQSIKEF